MKPFNLEQALAGKPVCTRNGSKVEQLTYFENVVTGQQLVGIIDGKLHRFYKNGIWATGKERGGMDLFMAEETFYIVLTDEEKRLGCIVHETELRATMPDPKLYNVYKLTEITDHEK